MKQTSKTYFSTEIFVWLKLVTFKVFAFFLSVAYMYSKENIVLGSNFQNVDFDGFTHFEFPNFFKILITILSILSRR